MSVSARTFQLLYIIRQRALLDQRTVVSDFSDFIADRRKTAPALYGQAYISPSAILDLLHRMTVGGLLTNDDGEYQLEHLGSQMADLLDGIDACTTGFIENYKEMVVKAALEQRARLGQGPATQQNLANATNISLDSTRRGLEALVNAGTVIEHSTGRACTYTLAVAPLAVQVATCDKHGQDNHPSAVVDPVSGTGHCFACATDPQQDTTVVPSILDTQDIAIADVQENIAVQTAADPSLKAALEALDDEIPIVPLTEEQPVPLGAVLQDNGPDVEPAAAVSQASPTGHWEAEWVPGDPIKTPEVMEAIKNKVASCPACDCCDEDCDNEDEDLPTFDWDAVPVNLRKALYGQAAAAGMGLYEFLVTIVETHQRRIRRVINGVDEQIIRTQMNEILTLQRIAGRRRG